jgi:hypothetical protein
VSTNHLIEILQNSKSSVLIGGFYFKNSVISDAKSILYGTSLNATISAEISDFSNNLLSDSISIIRLETYREANFSGVHFEGNKFENDDNNLLINLNDITSSVDSSINFSNVTVTNSTVPLLKVSNSNQSKTINQLITFDGITYKD